MKVFLLYIIVLGIALAVAAVIAVVSDRLKDIIPETKLDMELIPGDIDPVLESFKMTGDIDVAGLIGTDFMDKYGYVIDFKKGKVFHRLHSMSFKEFFELIGIPCIVLWQNGHKYIFIVDSGSSRSHISNKALETIDHEYFSGYTHTAIGCGGVSESKGLVKATFHYK